MACPSVWYIIISLLSLDPNFICSFSANLVFKQEFDENGNLVKVKACGGGFGHGVGMSQYGAGYMATDLGMPYEKILQHYYTGITLGTVPFILSANSEQNQAARTFYSKNGKAYLVIDNKYKVSYLDLNVNGNNYKFHLDSKERMSRVDLSSYIQKGVNTITFYYPAESGANKGLRIYVELAGKYEYSN